MRQMSRCSRPRISRGTRHCGADGLPSRFSSTRRAGRAPRALALLFEKHGVVFEREAMQEFALQTAGFSGSDLANLVHESAYARCACCSGRRALKLWKAGRMARGAWSMRVVEDGDMSDAAFDARRGGAGGAWRSAGRGAGAVGGDGAVRGAVAAGEWRRTCSIAIGIMRVACAEVVPLQLEPSGLAAVRRRKTAAAKQAVLGMHARQVLNSCWLRCGGGRCRSSFWACMQAGAELVLAAVRRKPPPPSSSSLVAAVRRRNRRCRLSRPGHALGRC